jgi:poly [ADP-ribose] polymerase
MTKNKVFKSGTEPLFPKDFLVLERKTLNFTDIVKNNNKFYNIELQIAPNGQARVHSEYGRVGGTTSKEYRVAADQNDAKIIFDKIIKDKTTRKKDPYVEVKLIKADVGSEAGKAKVDATATSVSVDSLKKLGVKVEEAEESKLHTEVAGLVRTWFGVTQEFIELNLDTKKCPLGQLSIDQIEKAKEILEEARTIVHAKKDVIELNRLTNAYYSNIPHNFGYGKINADVLRLDADDKIDKAFDILDVFADAKNVQNVISKKSAVDSQYATLNADLEWVEVDSPVWKWIDSMLHNTRANNHHFLGKLKTHRVFKVNRKGEEKNFLQNAERIAKECGKYSPSETYAQLVKSRPDISKELQDLYKRANINPGWHGTRRANMIGITTKGLLIRPSGVTHAGSMFGDAVYWATNSTKSMNYCDVKGSYWAQGNNKTAYLFLGDVAFGNYKMATSSYFYSPQNIKPYHSVFAQANKSGVVNDEIMTYYPTGPQQQHCLRYIIEFETLAK